MSTLPTTPTPTPTAAAPPRGDVSFTERLGHVRRDEYLVEGDVGWAPEATVATRKRAPPPEVPGDAFDRQRAVPDFDQGVVQGMRCLVLGAGGIGQNVAMLLARLGVAEIHLIDRDVYDATNLNRQLLGSPAAVGMRKVDAAQEGLLRGHVVPGATEVFAHHLDAVGEWARVAALARRSDVVFNGIDVGAAFDHAVASLGKELGVPVCVGQSYGWTYTSEYYPAHPDAPGGWDLSSVSRLFALGPTPPPPPPPSANDAPPPQSTVERLRALYGEGLGGAELPEIAAGLAGVRGPADGGGGGGSGDGGDAALADAFRAECVARLGAGRVAEQRDLRFLPRGRDAKIPTRYVGSWVVPCVGCATAMVGQWMAAVTGTLPDVDGGGGGAPVPRNPPTYVNYDVANGCTQEETAGRQMAETAEQWSGGAAMAVEEAAGLLLPPRQRSQPSEEGRRAAERSSPLLKGLLEDALQGLFFASGRVCLTEYAGTATATTATATTMTAPGDGDRPYTLVLGGESGGGGDGDGVWKASGVRVAEAAAAAAAVTTTVASTVPVTPQMPCKPLEVVLGDAGGGGRGSGSGGEEEAFPPMLAKPLVKVKVNGTFASALPTGDVVAAASGIRSALVWRRRRRGEGGGVGYRLKGCGNGADGGFTLLPVEGRTGRVTHRGCGFGSTAMAEVRMCAEMQRAGVEVGNFPVGVWVYDGPRPPVAPVSGGGGEKTPLRPPPPPPPLTFALKNDQKCCGLFRTVGDRRAGDHLIAGLTKLFPRMVPAACLSAALRPAILRSRGGGGEDEELMPTDTLAACGLPVSSPAAGLGGALREAPPAAGLGCGGSSGERFDLVWNLAVERLHCRLEACKRAAGGGGAVPSVLLHVLERVGWECGEAMRRMQAGGLSWGTFTDDLGTHCNAHANNMVVKPVTLLGDGPSGTLLAALDFDMAFDRGSWVGGGGGDSAGGGFATFDSFDDVVLFEQTNGMRQALAGSNFSSTGVANDAADGLPEGYPQDVLCAAVHDTLVAAFDAGLEGKPSPYRPEMAPAVHAVVLLALCLTSGVVA